MASNPYVSFNDGDSGGDIRTKLNVIGSSVNITFKRISAIANVASEVGYFSDNSIIYADNEKSFYYYTGSAWVLHASLNNIVKLDGDSMTGELDITVNSIDPAIETTQSGAGLSGKFGDGTNYTEFESDGSMEFVGTATVWNDLFVPLTQTKLGSNLKPDFDQTNIGYLFPQNDTSEILYMMVQIPHNWKEGSDIYPHVHWQQSQDLNVTFKMDYKWFDIGEAVPAGFTTYTMNQLINSYVVLDIQYRQ